MFSNLLLDKETRAIKYKKNSSAAATLVRQGYIPSAPLIPSIAYDIHLLELYRVLNKNHRRLGLQPFLRAVYEYQGDVRISTSAYTFSKAYDCYLSLRRNVKSKIDQTLGCGDPNARLLHACPACLYSLEGEPKLPYSFLAAADGNMSLRRFAKVGTADTARFDSSYFVSRDEVEKFAGVVQVRKTDTSKGKRKKQSASGAALQETEDAEDANLEMEGNEIKGPDVVDKEGGSLPVVEDPLASTFELLPSECAEKWKANADDNKKVMWDVFDECGVFITVCRHGILLLACDIVKSGEL